MMEARLAKVRQRKLKQNPGAPGESAEEPRYVLGYEALYLHLNFFYAITYGS